MHLEEFPVVGTVCARPRCEGPHLAINRHSRLSPVDATLVLLDGPRDGDAVLWLRNGADLPVDVIFKRTRKHLRTKLGQLIVEGCTRFCRLNPTGALSEDWA